MAEFLSRPELRRLSGGDNVLAHGPAHWMRSAWLAGARDYLKEPWLAEELFLRLRGSAPTLLYFEAGGHRLRLDGQRLAAEPGNDVGLTAAEAALLRLLVLRRGTTVSRSVLAWSAGCGDGRVVDTLVGRVRAKLRAVGTQESIVAVRGLGYRLP